MMDQMAIGIIIGFAFGAGLTAGVFYVLYLQVATELFEHVSDIKKTLGWLTTRMHEKVNEDDTDK